MHRIHYRFALVLGLILATITFALAAPSGQGAHLIAVSLQAATLVAAVLASRAHRWVIRLSAAAAAVGIAGSLAAVLGSESFDEGSALVVALPYALVTPLAIVSGLRKHFREEGVTTQTMFGVLCLYLLIGLLFGIGFGVVDEFSDGDFFAEGSARGDDFLYYSFATLTTVGYGDLVAGTDLGRSLSVTEALIGQIYLVTVVALIVSNIRPEGRRFRA